MLHGIALRGTIPADLTPEESDPNADLSQVAYAKIFGTDILIIANIQLTIPPTH
jgi:hypothetical protein